MSQLDHRPRPARDGDGITRRSAASLLGTAALLFPGEAAPRLACRRQRQNREAIPASQ